MCDFVDLNDLEASTIVVEQLSDWNIRYCSVTNRASNFSIGEEYTEVTIGTDAGIKTLRLRGSRENIDRFIKLVDILSFGTECRKTLSLR